MLMVTTANLIEHVIESKEKDELSIIHNSDYNLAIWERNPDERIIELTDSILEFLSTAFEATGTPEYCITELENKFFGSFSRSFTPLIDDIKMISNWFSELSGSKKINIFLGLIDNDMCKIFHTDINDLRLTTTYKGIGTVWTKNSNINRKTKVPEDCLLDPNDMKFVPPFHVAIMKGALHDKAGAGAIFHRSPSIKESGEFRLLLRIDTTNSFF